MILVKPSHEIMVGPIYPHILIEEAGRVCYKSEDKITEESAEKFVKMVIDREHHSVLEHGTMTVRFICDRGVTHEIVRHRIASYSQESTRYCNYKGGVTFVIPPWIDIEPGEYEYGITGFDHAVQVWFDLCNRAEDAYKALLRKEWSSQQARSVLPNSLKTEIVMTANLREWRHVFTLRCSKAAHPQMRELMIPLLKECKVLMPTLFEDIKEN